MDPGGTRQPAVCAGVLPGRSRPGPRGRDHRQRAGWEALLTGRLGEGRHWIDRVLDVFDECCADRATLLWIAAQCTGQGDQALAERNLHEARKIARQVDDRHEEAMATVFLGASRISRGALREAVELFDEALGRMARDDSLARAMLLLRKGKVLYRLGDPVAGIELCRESMAIFTSHRRSLRCPCGRERRRGGAGRSGHRRPIRRVLRFPGT